MGESKGFKLLTAIKGPEWVGAHDTAKKPRVQLKILNCSLTPEPVTELLRFLKR